MVILMTYKEMKSALSIVDDPAVRLEMVMDFGANMAPVPDDAVCNVIAGCASQVEICVRDGHFYGVADSALVRGIVAIILAMVDGKDIDEIKKMDLQAEFNSLDLRLGTGRLGGVNSMISFFKNL